MPALQEWCGCVDRSCSFGKTFSLGPSTTLSNMTSENPFRQLCERWYVGFYIEEDTHRKCGISSVGVLLLEKTTLFPASVSISSVTVRKEHFFTGT